MSVKILITCDVEALDFPFDPSSASRNIFGTAPDGAFVGKGIDAISSICAKYSITPLYFYDVFTDFTYPGTVKRVRDLILSYGHEIGLHTHIEHLDSDWWAGKGYKKPGWASNYYDLKTCEMVYGEAVNLFNSKFDFVPKCYRAGSWRVNSNQLRVLSALGVEYSFNYYPATTIRKNYPHGIDAGILAPFQWVGGPCEIPTGTILGPNKFSSTSKYYGFESHLFSDANEYLSWLDLFSSAGGKLAVLVMHSWAFLSRDNNQKFSIYDPRKEEAFSNFIERTVKNYEFISVGEIKDHIDFTNLMNVPLEFSGHGSSQLVKI